MGLTYQSTRGGEKEATASMTILQDLAKDDGLFMPSGIPELDVPPEKLAPTTYQETAHEVMKLFLTDYMEAELKDCITRVYDSKSDIERIAPPAKADGAYYLELYHGSTIAFEGMTSSILPHLMTTVARKNHVSREVVTLTATPGDTDKAVMAGFTDVLGIRIIVFYSKDGVSRVQEPQMRTQKGDNISVVTIRGSSDGTQTGMKKILGDKYLEAEFAGKRLRSSSANSTNIDRPVPQITYYIYAYAKLLEAGEIDRGEKINVAMPTGNSGNIFTAYFAKRMGLPVKTLVRTSNGNRVLYDFFTTRIYNRKRELIPTNSPSMDILTSNNLERLIYLDTGCDAQTNAVLMWRFSKRGRYEMILEMHIFTSDSAGGSVTQEQDAATIKRLFDDTGYPIDIHTGVAAAVYANHRREGGGGTKVVMASTTSPYKFFHSAIEAIAGGGGLEDKDEFEIMDVLNALSDVAVLQVVKEIRHTVVRHNRGRGVDDMGNEIKDILDVG